jgi:hypothetical protein
MGEWQELRLQGEWLQHICLCTKSCTLHLLTTTTLASCSLCLHVPCAETQLGAEGAALYKQLLVFLLARVSPHCSNAMQQQQLAMALC